MKELVSTSVTVEDFILFIHTMPSISKQNCAFIPLHSQWEGTSI